MCKIVNLMPQSSACTVLEMSESEYPSCPSIVFGTQHADELSIIIQACNVRHLPIKSQLAGIDEGCIQVRSSCLEALFPVS